MLRTAVLIIALRDDDNDDNDFTLSCRIVEMSKKPGRWAVVVAVASNCCAYYQFEG